jgi:CelD/BcsL family acetyltransferase involved in cellulose biosynthesis
VTRTAPAPVRTELLTGPGALRRLGPALDELHAATDCPVTARRPWLQTWAEHWPAYVPTVVVVTGQDGGLRAAAPLAVRRGPVCRVVALGHGPSDEVRLPSLGPVDAALLAAAVARALHGLHAPWLLSVRHLDPADDAVAALARVLPCAAVTPGDVSPRLAVGPDRSLRAHVSRHHHTHSRRLHNRLARDGVAVRIEHLTGADEVRAVWPEVEAVCRARDLQLRGRTALDDPREGPFMRAVVQGHAACGQVRLTTLRLDGRLAAYVLCFLDGAAVRMWNCRVHPDAQAYGPGRLANDAALEVALAEPTCRTFDFMRGEEPYKASLSNHAHRAVDLTAASSGALWLGVRGSARARGGLRRLREAGGPAGRLVTRLQPVLQRLDPVR